MSTFDFKPPYSLTGQVGKPLDSASRTLESLGIDSASLAFHSMEADTLTFHQRGGIEPEWMQEISLWDATGKRVFWGHVTEVDPELDGTLTTGFSVTVTGPWWWLEQAQVTEAFADSADNEIEAVYYHAPQQDLAVSIRALVERMGTIGVPLRCGDISKTYIAPQMTFQNETGADALRAMLAWLPDAMTRVRYDVGTPMLDVVRRSAADHQQIILGSEGDLTGAPIRILPRRELRPEQIEVQSMTLDAAGNILYSKQTAGSPVVSPIRRQIVPVSGLGRGRKPEDTIRRHVVKTVPFSSLYTALVRHHSGVAALKQEVGGNPYQNLVTGNVTIWVPINNGFTQYVISPRTAYLLPDGVTTTVPSTHIVVGEDLPDWWSATGIPAKRVKIQARWTEVAGNSFWGIGSIAALSKFQIEDGNFTHFFADLEIDCWTVDLDAGNTTGVVVVHPNDAALVQPTGTLAADLWQAQNWLPMEGSIPLHPGSTDGAMPGTTVSVRGGRPEWEGMRALVSSYSVNLRNGAAQVGLGAPVRQRGYALADRFDRPLSGRFLKI